MSHTIYFAALAFDNDQYVRECFMDEQDRERWIARHVEGKVYEGVKVISIARGEGVWTDVTAP